MKEGAFEEWFGRWIWMCRDGNKDISEGTAWIKKKVM